MKPHLPITLLTALLGSFVALGIEIPDDYKQIAVYVPSDLNDHTSTDKNAFILWADVDFTPTSNTAWTSSTPLIKGGSHIFTQAEDANTTLNFSNGKSQAFNGFSTLNFDTIDKLTIDSNNSTYTVEDETAGGGAIRGSKLIISNTNASISKNEATSTVVASRNPTRYSKGGAFYLSSAEMSKNGTLSFNNNHSQAITSPYIRSNSYAYGGAIYADTVSFDNNIVVNFENNYAVSKGHSYLGTYKSSSLGGAIYADTVTLSNNDKIEFKNNYTKSTDGSSDYDGSMARGGAIYANNLTITGNNSVIFEGNYESDGYGTRNRSVYVESTITLAAKTGGTITFFDSIYGGSNASFNNAYVDANGQTQQAHGDIIFSGSKSNINNINGIITLYGGSLQVIDGAQLNGKGLTVADGSGAKLVLSGGSMNHSGYNFTFSGGTALELQGSNTITASKLTLGSGAELSVKLSASNKTTAALTMGGTDLATSKLEINFERGDDFTSGTFKIISQSSSSDFTTSSAWTSENVTVKVNGDSSLGSFADLQWKNGTLYYNVGRTIWSNASGDTLWNSTSDNWTMNGRNYAYRDGMDVSFTDVGAGVVQLVGDISPTSIIVDNSAGHDYLLSAENGDGKLVGAGKITKNGDGVLTLATANSYTGGTVLNKGTLNVYHSTGLGATALGGNATITTLSGTTLNVGNSSYVVLAAANSIAGNVSVESGSLLAMKNSGYSAAKSDINGTLSFSGSAANTTKGGTLSGGGTVKVSDSSITFSTLSSFSGNMTVDGSNGGLIIKNGDYNAAGQILLTNGASLNLNSNNITVKNGGSLNVISNDGSISLTANNISIASGASLSVSHDGGENVSLVNNHVAGTVNVANLTLHSGASYTLQGAHLAFNNSEITLGVTTSAKQKINLVLSYGDVYEPDDRVCLFSGVSKINFIYDDITASKLIYTLDANNYFCGDWINSDTELIFEYDSLYITNLNNVTDPSSYYTWNNSAGDFRWDLYSLNWLQGGTCNSYEDGVHVIFGNEGAGEVILVGSLSPSSVLVDSSVDYTWSGDGGVCGDSALTKQGNSTLTINNANSYTGGTIINGGKIVVNNASALGAGNVFVNGGTIEIGVNGFTNAMSFAGNSNLSINDDITYTVQSAISNSGVLTLNGKFKVDALSPSGTIPATRVDVNGNAGNSGFAQAGGFTLQVVSGGVVNDDAAIITYNGTTITLNSNGMATVGGDIQYNQYHIADGHTASVSAIAAKSSSMGSTLGNISLAAGGTLNANASANVNATGGTIKLTSGTLSGTLQNVNLTASGGSISGTFSGNSTLSGSNYALSSALVNNGSLTLSGSFNADALAPSGTIAATRIDLNGNKGSSGFAQSAGFTLQVVSGGSVNDDAATITYNGQTITLDNTGKATVEGGIQYNQYHISSGHTASVSAIVTKASSMGSTLGNISLTAGGALNADASANVNATGGTIKLTSGTLSGSLQNVSMTANGGSISGTFSGNSTLRGSNYALVSALKNNGTLALSGSFKADALSKELTGVDVRVDVDGNEGGTSGFLRTGDFTVTLANGTVNSNSASVSYKGQALSMNGGIGFGKGTVDYTNYQLTDGNSASVSDILDAANGALKDITMTGGNLTVDDIVVLDATGGNIIITDDSTLSGSIVDADITTAEGEYNSLIDAVIGGGSSLTVNGGTITVTGDNSYTEGTTIDGGRLEVDHANALGIGGVTLNGGTLDLNSYPVGNNIFATGGTLEGGNNFGGKLTVNGDLTLGGETTAGGGILLNGGSISGGSIVDTDITVDGVGDMEISSDIRGNSSLTLNNGDLTISGSNNDYTGGTTINNGNLTIGSGSSLGSGDITLNGGTLNTNGQEITNNIVNNGGTLISSYILGEGNTLTVGKGGMNMVGNLTLAGGNLRFEGLPLMVDGKVESTAAVSVFVSGYGVIDMDGTVTLAHFGTNVQDVSVDSFINTGYGSLSYNSAMNTLNLTLTEKNVWVGGKDAVWMTGANAGWTEYKLFECGNRVVFNTKGTVKIVGGVEPASALVDVDKSLTFKTSYNKKTGLYSGAIIGDGCVVKRGVGKLTMNDGNTYTGGTFIEAGTVNAKGTTSFGKGAITLSGGTLNLASKAVANTIFLEGPAIIKGGAKFAASLAMAGELMKGSVVNINAGESATLFSGTVNGTISGLGDVLITGDVELGTTGKLTTAKLRLMEDTLLNVSAKGLAMNAKTSAIEIEGGKLTSAGKLSAYSLTMTGGELDVANAKPMAVSLKGDFKAGADADIDVYGAFSAAKLDLQGVTFTMGMEDATGMAVPKAQSISLKDKYADNLISATELNIGGKMSVAGNLTVNGASVLNFYDPSFSNKAQSLAVKGSLNFGGNSSLYLNGSLSAKDLTLGSGTLTLNGAKLATVKVGNSLTLEGGTTLNLGFSVKEKDKGKSFKIFTFKTISSSITDITDITDAALNELLGLGTDAATLSFDTNRKAITLTVTNVDVWNEYAESVRNGTWVPTPSEDDELVESSGAFVLARPTAAVDPLLGKVADTLVQSTWGTAGASRAFGDTIAARGTHATALADGKGAAWISTMGGSSRISSDGAHAGADYTLTGAAFGMEARLSEKSSIGLAIGNSWGKVSTFSAFPVDQDSTHQGIYGKHLLGSTTTLSWMAAHTRTESDANLAGMPCDWTQDALQLDARVDKLFAISDRTTVSTFVGMQYLATDKGECDGLSTGSLQNLRGEIGVSAAHKATDRTYLYGELSFIGDMVRNNPTATVGDYRSRGANPGRAGLNLSVGASYQLNDSWSLNGSYSLELMQNQTSHSANVGATYSF